MSSDSKKVKGIITEIRSEKKISEKFKVKEFGLKTDGEWPQEILLSTFNDKMKILDGFKVGDVVDVGVNIRGRRVGDAIYNTLEAWSLYNLGGKPAGKINAPNYKADAEPAKKVSSKKPVSASDEDDLPF